MQTSIAIYRHYFRLIVSGDSTKLISIRILKFSFTEYVLPIRGAPVIYSKGFRLIIYILQNIISVTRKIMTNRFNRMGVFLSYACKFNYYGKYEIDEKC